MNDSPRSICDDQRFYSPRQQLSSRSNTNTSRSFGNSSDEWQTPRLTRGGSILSDFGEFVTPREGNINGRNSIDNNTSKQSESRVSHKLVNDINEDEVSAIFSYARHDRKEAVENMLDTGIPVDIRNEFGDTLLIVAAQNGNKRIAKAALRRGANINIRNYKGNTPLHFCFQFGYGDSLGAYLISKGADARIRNNAGKSCFDRL